MSEHVITSADLGTLLVCTVRYAMHRQTYVVDDACTMVRAYAHAVSRADAEVIRVDIERELQRARKGGWWVGHREDHRQWEALATWLRERERAR